MRKVLKSDALRIGKEGAKDSLSSALTMGIFFMKGLLSCTSYVGTILGLGFGVDGMLKATGRVPLIGTLIGEGINKVLPPTEGQYKNYIWTYMELNEKKEWYEEGLKKAIKNGDVRNIKLLKELIKESNKKMEALILRIEVVEEYLERKGKKK